MGGRRRNRHLSMPGAGLYMIYTLSNEAEKNGIRTRSVDYRGYVPRPLAPASSS